MGSVKKVGGFDIIQSTTRHRGRVGGTYKNIDSREVVAVAKWRGRLIQLSLWSGQCTYEEHVSRCQSVTLQDIEKAFYAYIWRVEPSTQRVLVDEGLPTERYKNVVDYEGAARAAAQQKQEAKEHLIRRVPKPLKRKR